MSRMLERTVDSGVRIPEKSLHMVALLLSTALSGLHTRGSAIFFNPSPPVFSIYDPKIKICPLEVRTPLDSAISSFPTHQNH